MLITADSHVQEGLHLHPSRNCLSIPFTTVPWLGHQGNASIWPGQKDLFHTAVARAVPGGAAIR